MDQPEAQAPTAAIAPDVRPVTSPNGDSPAQMDAQLMEALSDILADALLADLEAEMEEEHAVAVATAESPTGIGSRTEHLVATSPRTSDAA